MVDYLRLRCLRQEGWIQRWMLCSEPLRLPQQYYASLYHYVDTAVNDFLHHLLQALPCGCDWLSPLFGGENGVISSVSLLSRTRSLLVSGNTIRSRNKDWPNQCLTVLYFDQI